MRFAHIADCHLGAWGTHPDLREFPLRAFAAAVDRILAEKLDFVLLCGDFFDNSMPAVDILRFAAEQLMRLKLAGIAVYSIAGSHDYSPTGKTMLSVLEAADLLENAHMRWIERNGVRIFGIEGLRGGLDREQFDKIRALVPEGNYNIFMFHAAVDELSGMSGVPLSALPNGFDYYATGHVHSPLQSKHGDGKIVFPGPLFPAEFSELEKLGCGSFCIVEIDGKIQSEQIKLADVTLLSVDCNGKSPQQIESELLQSISDVDIEKSIVLLKATGTLSSGKPTDVNWKRITELAQQEGARAVKKSVHLTVKAASLAKTDDIVGGLEQIEQTVIARNVQRIEDKDTVLKLMSLLAVEKSEDEKNATYEEKIKTGMRKILGLN